MTVSGSMVGGGGFSGGAERTRIADRVPDRIAVAVGAALAVVGEQRALAKRLERGAPLGHAAVGPREEHLLALGLRQGGEALDPAAGDRAEQMGVPQAEQLSHLLALGSARVARHERKQRLRHAELGRRRQTVAARSERVADGVEGGAGLGRECGGAHAPTLGDGASACQGRAMPHAPAIDSVVQTKARERGRTPRTPGPCLRPQTSNTRPPTPPPPGRRRPLRPRGAPSRRRARRRCAPAAGASPRRRGPAGRPRRASGDRACRCARGAAASPRPASGRRRRRSRSGRRSGCSRLRRRSVPGPRSW